jgi:hypothetical protein
MLRTQEHASVICTPSEKLKKTAVLVVRDPRMDLLAATGKITMNNGKLLFDGMLLSSKE